MTGYLDQLLTFNQYVSGVFKRNSLTRCVDFTKYSNRPAYCAVDLALIFHFTDFTR